MNVRNKSDKTSHSRNVSGSMNVMNENGETSSSRNVGGDMNVVNASDDSSFSANVSGNLEVINESDKPSHSGNVNRGLNTENLSADENESGFFSHSLSSRDDKPSTDFFVDVRTLQKPKPHWLFYPRILNSLVQNTDPWPDAETLLADLQKDNCTIKREKLWKQVEKVLQNLAGQKDFRGLIAFLQVNEYQSSVVSHLENLLLDLRKSQDLSVTEQLLEVAKGSLSALMKLGHDSVNLLPMTCLHLMTVSALLSRCPRPSQDQWSNLGISKKQSKKENGEGLKHMMVNAVQAFHEHLEGVSDKASSFQQWSQAGFSEGERSKRMEDFSRASFCEVIVIIFTILSELKRHGRRERGHNLLKMLQDLYNGSSVRSRKRKGNKEAKAAMDVCLVRQMVSLLKSTFSEEEPQVGEQFCEHSQLIAHLTTDVIKGADPSLKHFLLREIEFLPFIASKKMRETFNLFFLTQGQPLPVLAQGYMATNLQSIRFHRHSSITFDQSVDSASSHETCAWQTFTCTVGHKEAEGAMFIPKASCLVGSLLDKCVPCHPGCQEHDQQLRQKIAERAQRHIHNLNILKNYSPQCRYLLQLYSYQFLPFPFYITEEVQQHRLLTYILDHRNSELWLDTSTLIRVTRDVIEALTFLASRNIDPRDVTAYNTVIRAGAGTYTKSFGARCSVLTLADFVVKLADLGLCHEFLSNDPMYSNEGIRPVRDQGAVPVRWTSPEALFEGRYSEKNMVYSVGCLMYELWTHGCQPFTSYDQTKDTYDILSTMLTQPGIIQLASRPCIPDAVYDLIRRCTHHNPDNRPSLLQLKEELSQLAQDDKQNELEPGLESALFIKMKYPQLSQGQIARRHVPETGIPTAFQRLIDAGKNSDLYSRARQSKWVPSSKTKVTDEELHTDDWIHIQTQEDRTLVEEVVSQKFLREVLPSLEASDLQGVTCWSREDDSKPRLLQQDDLRVQTREYPLSVSLKTAAMRDLLWEEENQYHLYDVAFIDLNFLVPFLSLARAVHEMHEKGWINRDLKEDNILIDCQSGQAMLPRVGRMRRLASSESYFVDDVFEDSRRWLAPEVLVGGQYGKENDVFMLGTVMWQVFRIIGLAAKNPAASDRDFAPCSCIEKENVIDYVRDHGREHVPARCPLWLYQLIMDCRHPDPGQRPSAQHVVDTLQQHSDKGPTPTPFIKDPNVERYVYSAVGVGAELAEVRRRRKRAENLIKRVHAPPLPRRLGQSNHHNDRPVWDFEHTEVKSFLKLSSLPGCSGEIQTGALTGERKLSPRGRPPGISAKRNERVATFDSIGVHFGSACNLPPETNTDDSCLIPVGRFPSEEPAHSSRFPPVGLSRLPFTEPAAEGSHWTREHGSFRLAYRPDWQLWQSRYFPPQTFEDPRPVPAQGIQSPYDLYDSLDSFSNCSVSVEWKSEGAANHQTHAGAQEKNRCSNTENNFYDKSDENPYEQINDVHNRHKTRPLPTSQSVFPRGRARPEHTDARQATNTSDDDYTRRGEEATERYQRHIAPRIASKYAHDSPSSHSDVKLASQTLNKPPCLPPRTQFKESIPLRARESDPGVSSLVRFYETNEREDNDSDEDSAVTIDYENWCTHAYLVDPHNPQQNQVISFKEGARIVSPHHGVSPGGVLNVIDTWDEGRSSQECPLYVELY